MSVNGSKRKTLHPAPRPQRPQPMGSRSYGGSSSLSALSNGAASGMNGNATPYIILLPLNDSFEPKCISLTTLPDVVKVGRQTNKSTAPGRDNAYFDSKVLSRAHAEMWFDPAAGSSSGSNSGTGGGGTGGGRVYIKDIRSSNGTFVNGVRLSKENEESEPKEICPGDTLELGIDILDDDTGAVLHRKVSARIDHAGLLSSSAGSGAGASGRAQSYGASGRYGGGSVNGRLPNGYSAYDGSNGYLNAANHNNNGGSGGGGGNGQVNGFGSLSNGGGNGGNGYGTIGRNAITVDMVVKKLSNDLRLSRRQAEDLKSTSDAFHRIGNTRSSSSLSLASRRRPLAELNEEGDDAHGAGASAGAGSQRGVSKVTKSTSTQAESSASPSALADARPAAPDVVSAAAEQLRTELATTRSALDLQQRRVGELESVVHTERVSRIEAEQRCREVEQQASASASASLSRATNGALTSAAKGLGLGRSEPDTGLAEGVGLATKRESAAEDFDDSASDITFVGGEAFAADGFTNGDAGGGAEVEGVPAGVDEVAAPPISDMHAATVDAAVETPNRVGGLSGGDDSRRHDTDIGNRSIGDTTGGSTTSHTTMGDATSKDGHDAAVALRAKLSATESDRDNWRRRCEAALQELQVKQSRILALVRELDTLRARSASSGPAGELEIGGGPIDRRKLGDDPESAKAGTARSGAGGGDGQSDGAHATTVMAAAAAAAARVVSSAFSSGSDTATIVDDDDDDEPASAPPAGSHSVRASAGASKFDSGAHHSANGSGHAADTGGDVRQASTEKSGQRGNGSSGGDKSKSKSSVSSAVGGAGGRSAALISALGVVLVGLGLMSLLERHD